MPDVDACSSCGCALPTEGGVCPACHLNRIAAGESAGSAATVPLPADCSSAETPKPVEGPPRFGGYEILGELGRGGMGVVYKARQIRADRVVALKVIKGAAGLDGMERERFRTEAVALARLRHPNIVQVYDVGEEAGCPYFSMEYVEGGSLAARLRRQPLSPAESARIVETLAGAMEAAHKAGILHRDLKPGNVLLAREPSPPAAGSQAACGTPLVSDFGLAKRLEVDEGLTPTGTVLGTPSYMAPEQAGGRTADIDPRTDVYALGATLYELLAGVPPFRGASTVETILLVLSHEPLPPSRRRAGVPLELEAICLKCLEKDPACRYASAAALADDLGRWRRGECTAARPAGWLRRLGRVVRRRPLPFAAVVLLVVTTVGALEVSRRLDPELPRRTAEAELAAGRKVTLVGTIGPPRWSRWRRGAGAVRESPLHDNAFSFDAVNESLLELITDPHCRAYRFRAEVRHNGTLTPNNGFVGLYFGDQRYNPGKDLRVYTGFRLYFLDNVPQEKNKLKPEEQTSDARLQGFISKQVPGKEESTAPFAWVSHPFVPVRVSPRPWRKLAVEVTPDSVRAYWAGGEAEDYVEIQRPGLPGSPALDAGRLQENTRYCQESLEQFNRLTGANLTLRAWEPRSGLGLYAHRSSVSFRNVLVEPLSPTRP